MRNFNKFKEIVKPGYVYLSTITALVSGTICSIANVLTVSLVTHIAFIFFCISISAILAQLLFAVCICNESLENMNAKNSAILIPSCADQAQNELSNLLNDQTEDVDRILIICYGTSGYNHTISQVYNRVIKRKIKFDVMVCSPDVVYQNSSSDKEKIDKLVKEVSKDCNFHFYYAKYLPTIRGCVVYNKKGEPIWNCVQTYCYSSKDVFSSASYENSYAVVGRKENTYILKNNAEIVETEFERLKKNENPIGSN